MKDKHEQDKRFMHLASVVGSESRDESTKIGAIVVFDSHILATGYNQFPPGINEAVKERHARPAKYAWTEHAERVAIYDAARRGATLIGSTMYVNGLRPCYECARAIIFAGIKTLVVSDMTIPEPNEGHSWRDSMLLADEMLNEAGIAVYQL
jgi:dCMP deaminase